VSSVSVFFLCNLAWLLAVMLAVAQKSPQQTEQQRRNIGEGVAMALCLMQPLILAASGILGALAVGSSLWMQKLLPPGSGTLQPWGPALPLPFGITMGIFGFTVGWYPYITHAIPEGKPFTAVLFDVGILTIGGFIIGVLLQVALYLQVQQQDPPRTEGKDDPV
jgi:hypothetical protein